MEAITELTHRSSKLPNVHWWRHPSNFHTEAVNHQTSLGGGIHQTFTQKQSIIKRRLVEAFIKLTHRSSQSSNVHWWRHPSNFHTEAVNHQTSLGGGIHQTFTQKQSIIKRRLVEAFIKLTHRSSQSSNVAWWRHSSNLHTEAVNHQTSLGGGIHQTFTQKQSIIKRRLVEAFIKLSHRSSQSSNVAWWRHSSNLHTEAVNHQTSLGGGIHQTFTQKQSIIKRRLVEAFIKLSHRSSQSSNVAWWRHSSNLHTEAVNHQTSLGGGIHQTYTQKQSIIKRRLVEAFIKLTHRL